MTNEQIFSPGPARPQRPFRGSEARGPIIDQDGNEIRSETVGPQARGFRFDFGNANANPFANLTREQRLARLMRWRSFWTLPSSCPAPTSATASTASSG
jgi:hypothetical protein